MTEKFLGWVSGKAEFLQTEVLGSVEQNDLGGFAVASGSVELLVVGVVRTNRT
ncbi:hypothetical protein [Amycolatopsis sp. cmx-11-51]|uniref:hypothetical protein n=1 Tax=Amycolatopsis sp. cmx-11-51 TaxID=2785797 RepID=UPI0039E70B27